MSVSATEVGRKTLVDQIVDSVLSTNYKWFSLQDNILDGSFHPLDSAGVEQIGWWGTQLSGAGGAISSPPTITITETRSIHNLYVVGDDKLNEYPVDFDIVLYNGVSVIYSESVVGNTQLQYIKTFSVTYDVTKIEITVSKVNKVGRTVKLLEGFNIYNFNREDTLSVVITEVIMFIYPLLVKLLETSFVEVQLFSTDDVLVALEEDSTITNYLEDSSTLLVKIVENKDTTGYIYTGTTLKVLLSESKAITNYLYSAKSLLVKLVEAILMRNVYTLMDADVQLVYCKVEILYTDPVLDLNLVISASEEAYHSTMLQIADGVMEPTQKWFVLDNNILDGTFHPIDHTLVQSIGWRGTSIGDINGTLAVVPLVTLQADPRGVHSLQVVGDSLTNLFPKDFVIKLYNDLDVLLYTETVTDNTQVNWDKNIASINNIAKMTLEITKVNVPYTAARVVEFYSLVQETYDEDRLQTVDILEEAGYVSGNVPLGNISANEVDITLNNFDYHFDKSNPTSPVASLLKRNRRVKVWFGVEVIPSTIEWYLSGIFWTISWNVPTDTLTVSLVARDKLELMRQTDFSTSLIYEGYTILGLFEVIFTDYGLVPGEYYIDPYLDTLIIPFAWFTVMSHRDALQRLAGCSLVRVYCTKLGVVEVVYNPQGTENIMVTWDDNINLFTSTYPLAWEAITNFVEVKATVLIYDTSQEIYNDTITYTLAAGASTTLTYNFSKVPVKDVLTPILTADADVVVDSYIPYAWGAIVTIKNEGVGVESVYGISIDGTPLISSGTSTATAKDAIAIQEEGSLKTTIAHDFIQSLVFAQQLADTVLLVYNSSEYDVNLSTRGNIALRLGDRIHVNGNARSPEGDYVTTRQKISWNGALSSIVEGKKIVE